jgi:phosphohistidine phosphatase
MLEVQRSAKADTVMIIDHNPGIAEFAGMLPARGRSDPSARKYPTGATLVLDFQIPDWTEAAFGAASVLDFFVPSKDD